MNTHTRDAAQGQANGRCSLEDVVLMLDTEEEVNVARKRLGATALVFDHFSLSPPNCNSKLCLVVSREDAYERARRLIDLGMPPMDVMFIDLPSHLTLAKMTKRKDFQAILNSLLKDPRNPLLLDHVRPLVQWESPTPPEFVPCGEEAIGDGLNWQLPSITTWVGDCRSDASTLATLFALKQMLTPKGAVDVVVEVPASSAKASRARTGSSVLWSSVEAGSLGAMEFCRSADHLVQAAARSIMQLHRPSERDRGVP